MAVILNRRSYAVKSLSRACRGNLSEPRESTEPALRERKRPKGAFGSLPFWEHRSGSLRAGLRLIALDQIADALGIGFAVAVAGDGIGTASGFDANLSPKHAG
jgi:hypothetical protein